MPGIVTLTVNPTIDKSSSVGTVASEIKMRCDPPTFHPGGGGINVSRVIHKLGGGSTVVYTSGGEMGVMLTDLLHQDHLTTRPVPIAGLTRQNLSVYEESSGLQYRFGMPGPAINEEEANRCLDAALESQPDYLVASGSLAPGMSDDFYAQLLQRTQGTDTRVIVDTSGTALEAVKGGGAFLLKPNLRELEVLSGTSFQGEKHVQEMGSALIADGWAEVLVVSMGGGGAVCITADSYVRLRPPVVPIQSKVGAGDSMVGGIVWALAAGKELLDSIRYGVAAGSAAVMTPGTELCYPEDVWDLYERIAVMD